jgi:hypothetical protein
MTTTAMGMIASNNGYERGPTNRFLLPLRMMPMKIAVGSLQTKG